MEPVRQPDELFGELDGSDLTTADGTWHVEVYSILDDADGRWIQLGLSGPGHELATLRLPHGGGATHVTLALNEWFARRNVDLA